jgi:hypothetical protein
MSESIASASQRLLSLAAGLAQHSGIRVKVSDGRWAWNASNQTLVVARDSIATLGADICFGYVAHEIGHCLISRYPYFDRSRWSKPVANMTLNALEDPRAERYMALRYPGVGPWLARLAELGPQLSTYSDHIPYLVLFGLGCVREHHSDWQQANDDLPVCVRDALLHTHKARRAYALTLPPADLVFDNAALQHFETTIRLQLIELPIQVLDTREMGVLASAGDAYHIADELILPVAQTLHEADIERLARGLDSDPKLIPLAGQLLSLPLLPVSQFVSLILRQAVTSYATPTARALQMAETLLNELSNPDKHETMVGMVRRMLASRPGTRVGGEPDEAGEPNETVIQPSYESLREAHAQAIDHLVREIEDILQPRRHPRVKTGFASGVCLDLRKAMAFEADPRHHANLWQRRQLPQRNDLAVFLLVDLSGSMHGGGKDDAAMAAMVIMTETLARTEHVRWAAAGFQDELIPIADFGEGLTCGVRERIERIKLEINDQAPQGHNCSRYNDDGPAVLEASKRLLGLSASQRLLIVISDGRPEGLHSSEDDLSDALRDAEAAGISLVGVGIGAGTEHVAQYYPRHLAEVPVVEFPQRMGALVRELLTE